MANCKILNRLLMLLLTASTTVCSTAQNINKPNKMGPMGTQVNTQTGNLYISRNDLMIPARGFNLDIAFSYNSFNYDQNSGFGNGWSFAYTIQYKNDTANSKTICWGDGREDHYKLLSGNLYQSPVGFFNTLTQYQPNKYLLTELDGTRYYFDNNTHKRITRMEDANGNFLQFNYTDTLLFSLVNKAGQSISFTYNAAGNLATVVDAIAAPSRTYAYSYDGNNNLTQVTDPLSGTNKYSYLINGPMKSITDKNNNSVDIIYFSNFSISEIIGCNKRVSFSYDTATNVTMVTDHLTTGNNQVTKYGYKKSGDQVWLSSISGNCCGFNLSFEFDGNGNKIRETDANGNVYHYTYDARGNLLTTTDPLNRTSAFTYSANYNQITSYTDPKGNVYTMTYDANGNLTQLKEPGNNIYQAVYDANGDIVSSTDPKGNVYHYSFDSYGNPVSVSGPGGYHATLATDARGNLLSFSDARNNTHTVQYDILNRLKKVTDPLNNNLQINYDAEGNAISMVNKNNETSIFNYDASNRIVKFKDPIGNLTQLNYDGMDNIISTKNALGNQLSFTYDTRNRLSGTKDALGNSNSISYDANGNVTSLNLANGETVNYTYNGINRITAISDLNGTIGAYTYDKNNNITSYTNGTGATTTIAYDSLNRMTKITDPVGFYTQLNYDKNNNIVSVTDRNGAITNYTYDSLNRVKTYTDKNGFVTTAVYDAEGNVIQAKDQNNNITAYTYDSLNRLKTTTYPDGRFLQYGYDKKGNVIAKRLTDGSTINFQYDSLNRVIVKTLPGGEIYSYQYDALSRVVAATNGSGTVAITYDALNRITSETFDGRTTRYNYNIAGRTQTTIYPDSTIVTKNFDTRNRLTSIAKNNATLVSYQYNNANQVTVKNFANGLTSSMQYDFANRLSNISTATGSIQNTSFTYDKERNKTNINRLNNPSLSEQFTYDNGNRLTSYKQGVIGGTPTLQNTYSFDAVGNRTSAILDGTTTTYTTNNLNQLTSSNNGSKLTNFMYDHNGNLAYDGLFYKTYDAEGRLIKDSSAPLNVLKYQYDAFNRRVVKNFNGIPLKYSYSGLAQIEERNGLTNNITGKTVFTNFLTPILNEKNNQRYYFHQNELNSVEAISDSSGGLTERYQYDVYGKPAIYNAANNIIPSSLAGNRFGYTGQEYDSANGNYRFHFRNYSPATGTFNQRDLIGYGDGMGMYQYVHNNPANGIDIFGLNDCPPTETATSQSSLTHAAEEVVTLGSNYVTTLTILNMLHVDLTIASEAKLGIDALIEAGEFEKAGAAAIEANKIFDNARMLRGVGSGLGKLGFGVSTVDALIKGNAFGNAINDYNSGKIDGYQLTKSGSNLGASLVSFSGIGSVYGLLDFAQEKLISGRSMNENAEVGGKVWGENSVDQKMDEELMEFHRKNGTIKQFLKFYHKTNRRELLKNPKPDCPQNGGDGGTQKPNPNPNGSGTVKPVLAIGPKDPNEIIGPDGEPTKRWVSVKDRLPYTILYENDKSASAPAKFVRVTTAIEPKQDAATFQLGNLGFNNQTFTVPQGIASYYQRLDCIDSLGLLVDVTAGYDPVKNQAFWEFQAIDPVTLLPPADPLKGFVLQQDSLHPNYGHGFVNFSIKPKQTAITLDTIGARAAIVFDFNDTIATNVANNTIDAFAPTSHMNPIAATGNNTATLSWGGVDDGGGCGLKYYTLYVSKDGVNFNIVRSGITRTDTSFTGSPNTTFYFFVLATDSVGNTEMLRPGEVLSVYFSGGTLPVTWLYFKGSTQGKNNLLEWATAAEQNSREFKIERSLNGATFNTIGSLAAAGNSNQAANYQYKDYNIDRLNSPVMFYRLKQFDKNGAYQYSNIVRLSYSESAINKSMVYPNPTAGLITITIGNQALIGTQAGLYDANGRLLQSIKIIAVSQTIDLGKYVNGTYFIKLSKDEVLKVIKM